MGKVRLADIAQKVGISLVSVSNALSGKPGISEEKRQEIIDVATKMGYDFSKYEKNINDIKGKQIGVLVPQKFLEVDHSFYWELYQNLVCEISKKESFAVLEILPNEMIESEDAKYYKRWTGRCSFRGR